MNTKNIAPETKHIELGKAKHAIGGIRFNFNCFRKAYVEWKKTGSRFFQGALYDGRITHFEIVGGDNASLHRLLCAGLLATVLTTSGEIRRAAVAVGVKLEAFTAWREVELNFDLNRPSGPDGVNWNPGDSEFKAIIKVWPKVINELEDLASRIGFEVNTEGTESPENYMRPRDYAEMAQLKPGRALYSVVENFLKWVREVEAAGEKRRWRKIRKSICLHRDDAKALWPAWPGKPECQNEGKRRSDAKQKADPTIGIVGHWVCENKEFCNWSIKGKKPLKCPICKGKVMANTD